ncbi:hypothetical protein FQR65_LT20665 [Abscondita terminalis]|nr:hypothetical protein FQR65_LT20665 [Abscondita terminalis]
MMVESKQFGRSSESPHVRSSARSASSPRLGSTTYTGFSMVLEKDFSVSCAGCSPRCARQQRVIRYLGQPQFHQQTVGHELDVNWLMMVGIHAMSVRAGVANKIFLDSTALVMMSIICCCGSLFTMWCVYRWQAKSQCRPLSSPRNELVEEWPGPGIRPRFQPEEAEQKHREKDTFYGGKGDEALGKRTFVDPAQGPIRPFLFHHNPGVDGSGKFVLSALVAEMRVRLTANYVSTVDVSNHNLEAVKEFGFRILYGRVTEISRERFSFTIPSLAAKKARCVHAKWRSSR